MKKDLTKVPGSISYEYLQVMPKIYDLQNNKDLTASEKREEILIVAMQALNKANTKTATYDRKRNELIRDYEYSDTGILMALKYWYGVKKNPVEKAVGSGLGIVPYIYDEAQAYYKNLIELKIKLRKNYEQNQDINAKTIKIKKDKKPKDKGLIDINALKECE